MKKLSMLLVAGVCALLSSCSNEDIVESPVKVGDKEVAEVNTLDFIYKGKLYSSEFQYADADSSDIIVLDQEAAIVWKSLAKNASLAGFLHDDGVIEYFDSKEEQNEMITSIEEILTRTVAQTSLGFTSVTLNCFKDTGCKGKTVAYKIDSSNRWIYNRNDLSIDGMNDEISAFSIIGTTQNYAVSAEKVKSAFVDFYQHPDYQGEVLTVRLLPHDPVFVEKKLKGVKKPGGGNWNDKFSSLKMHCVISTGL